MRFAIPDQKLHVQADAKLLRRAMENFISNAMNYKKTSWYIPVDLDVDKPFACISVLNDSAKTPALVRYPV